MQGNLKLSTKQNIAPWPYWKNSVFRTISVVSNLRSGSIQQLSYIPSRRIVYFWRETKIEPDLMLGPKMIDNFFYALCGLDPASLNLKPKYCPNFFNFFEINFFIFFFCLHCITLKISFCTVRWLIFINFSTFTFSLPRIAFCAKLRDNCLVWMKSCLLLFCHTVLVSSSEVGKISRFTSTYFSSVLQAARLQQKQNLWFGWCLSVFSWSGGVCKG